jgi:hypothetical protein
LYNNSVLVQTNGTPGLEITKGCIRLPAAIERGHQLLARGRWFFLGIPASSTTNTGRHDIAAILLKVALSTINQSII